MINAVKTETKTNYLSPEEYLILEEKNPLKHEYINGEIYAMAGASDRHVTIAGNLYMLLRNHLRGSGCRVYISDMKLKLETKNCFYYPDLLVTCENEDQAIANYKKYPKLIVEILSNSTEAFDRGDKFSDYQSLETLEEYVLINSKKQRVECFRRKDNQLWILQTYTDQDQNFELISVNFTGKINELYEDINF